MFICVDKKSMNRTRNLLTRIQRDKNEIGNEYVMA